MSELDLDEADVEELHGVFERADIELVEELDPALAVAARECAPDPRGRRKPRPAFLAAVLLASACEHRRGADAGP